MGGKSKRNRSRGFKSSKEQYSRADSIDAFNTADVLPNPDPIWKRRRTIQNNYQDILWDPHLSAVISSRKDATLSKIWRIEPAKAPARVVKFIKEAFANFDVYRSTSEILDSRSFGMQPMVPLWGTPKKFEGENKIFPTEFTGRPPYWFQFDNKNELRFRTKENPHPGEDIKPYSLILPRNNPKYDNPYGEALLSKVYWSVNFKKGGFKFWVEFAEKYGSPFLIGSSPREVGEPEFDAFFDRLVEMTKGSVMVKPKNSSIEALDVGKKSSADIYKELVAFANSEISKAYLGGTLTADAGDKGARALGDVHQEVRHDLAESDEILAEDCFNQLIRWTVDLNFGENIEAPIFKYEHEEDVKLGTAERDSKLVEQGVRLKKQYYVDTYGFDEDDFEVEEPPEKNPGEPGQQFAEDNRPDDVKAVHKFLDELSPEELQEQAEFIEPIIKLIQDAGSFSEVEKNLIGLFDKVRPRVLEKRLGRAMNVTETVARGTNE